MGTISRFNISQLKKKFNLSHFVETGTMNGDGVDYALQSGFDKIISIEIEDTLVKRAREKYSKIPGVEIAHGDSSVVIVDIVNRLNGNALFWLDAHFPGADAGVRPYSQCLEYSYNTRLPLEAEINCISSRRNQFNDVIVCDDLWVYKDGLYGAGEINEHCRRHNHNITKEQIAEGKTIQFAYDAFANTHEFKEIVDDQGYLIIYPKE